ncbi:hypothetical protein BH11MYX4_BH11MYX4_00030 [soil metagenome]
MNAFRARHCATAAIVLAVLGACGTDNDAQPTTTTTTTTTTGPDGSACVDPCGLPDGSAGDGAGKVDGGPDVLVETRPSTPLGLAGISVNGRIQPRGRPTSYYVEYGATTAYGSKTTTQGLPPKLTAYYHESWNSGLAGWAGGMDGNNLVYMPTGGTDGGFVRYTFPEASDSAHADGIGANSLIQYMYPSAWDAAGVQLAAFSGGDPDMRGARVTVSVRGNAFLPKKSEMVFWLQSTPNLHQSYEYATARWSNWAFTGTTLTDGLLTGGWEKVEYRLVPDTTQWTYAGHNVAANRETYLYVPLDQVLGHLNGDLFHMVLFFEFSATPEGSIDVDEFEVAYPNRSVIQASNGGHLISSPKGGDDPARLVDGWRNGPNKTWRSAPAPQGPIEFVYELDRPVVLDAVQLHQNPDWPAKDIEVLISADGVSYDTLAQGVVPATAPAGVNYAFYVKSPDKVAQNEADGIPVLPWLSTPVKRIKVRVLSGYKPEYWGLGEIEAFGTGAVMQTDDDWYSVTTDIKGLSPGGTYHYRLVAKTDAGLTYGPDVAYAAAATAKPQLTACAASRLRAGTAKVEARLDPQGLETYYSFEYGTDTTYGSVTETRYGGLEITPRSISDTLSGLVPGTTYHYRSKAVNAVGTGYGADLTFVAK